MAVTMERVAKHAGVSLKTVSRVVNGEDNVTQETREKVLHAITELEYVPNLAARRLSRGKAMTIGVVLGFTLASTYSSTMVDFIQTECTNSGYNLALFSKGKDELNQVVQAYQGKQIDGVILDTIAGKNADLRKQLDSMQVPYLVIHPNSGYNDNTSYVTINDDGGAKAAVKYLIDIGHTSIGCLIGGLERIQNVARLNGYREALLEAGIPGKESLVYLNDPSDFSLGHSGALHLISNNNDLTAIFCCNDEVAMGAMSAIWQAGRKIPDDISVVGFDDIRYAAMVIPPLTTIRQPIEQIAKLAVNHLIKMINDPSAAQMRIVLPTQLVVRETCKPI